MIDLERYVCSYCGKRWVVPSLVGSCNHQTTDWLDEPVIVERPE